MDTRSPLLDLDELALLCRDEKARMYINEAASCYRAGAFRAAIVVTWVAVCYDIIDKLREIALAGDKEAAKRVGEVDNARKQNDFARLLTFERNILKIAEDEFELISLLERQDLERLQLNRNRCAHPSMVSEDQAFNPPGELARLHIRTAVMHLLQHQPVQGKYALERLLNEVDSQYFPKELDKAISALSNGPLKRARISLIRVFCTVLIKECTLNEVDYNRMIRLIIALDAVKAIHHEAFLAIIKEQLPKICQTVDDNRLFNLMILGYRIP